MMSYKNNHFSKYHVLRIRLRKNLDSGDLIVAPGVDGPFYAKLVEKAGFDNVYMTGFGSAANILGVPDVGLLTMSEMVTNVKKYLYGREYPSNS